PDPPCRGTAGTSAYRRSAHHAASGRCAIAGRRRGRDGESLQRRRHGDPAGCRQRCRGTRRGMGGIRLRRHRGAGLRAHRGKVGMCNYASFLGNVTQHVLDMLLSLGWIGMVIWIVLKIRVIAVPVILAVAFYVVWERKLIGWMHVRHGPMYVGWGVLQAFADVFKLLFKEVIQPSAAHRSLYLLAPLITLAPALALDSTSCASNGTTAQAGLLYLLAMTS